MSEQKIKRDPEGTRRRILEAATDQFTKFGLAGARVDAIATAADTNERMLYYYFTSKEGLYVSVLETMYARFGEREANLDLSGLQPAEAIRKLAESIWVHLRENPQWLSLINNENLHEGRYLERSGNLRETISPVIDLLRQTLERGMASGEFRQGIDPLDFYVTVVGMGYYVVSNRFTLNAFTGRDYSETSRQDSIAAMHIDMLIAYLASGAPAAQQGSSGTGQDRD
jgi:AcrR family transcriptional regulator